MKPGLRRGDKSQSELSESRVLRRRFECERQEVTGEWIKFYNVLYDLYATKYPFSLVQQPNLGLGHFHVRLLDHMQFRLL